MKDLDKIFSCTMCGFCCHGETTVSLNEQDQKRMIKALGMSEEEVKKKFWRTTAGEVQMKVVEGHCIFYKDGCTVHEGRPWRCRQWPLHPAVFSDENNFETICSSCPGINENASYEQFCHAVRESEKLLERQK